MRIGNRTWAPRLCTRAMEGIPRAAVLALAVGAALSIYSGYSEGGGAGSSAAAAASPALPFAAPPDDGLPRLVVSFCMK